MISFLEIADLAEKLFSMSNFHIFLTTKRLDAYYLQNQHKFTFEREIQIYSYVLKICDFSIGLRSTSINCMQHISNGYQMTITTSNRNDLWKIFNDSFLNCFNAETDIWKKHPIDRFTFLRCKTSATSFQCLGKAKSVHISSKVFGVVDLFDDSDRSFHKAISIL